MFLLSLQSQGFRFFFVVLLRNIYALSLNHRTSQHDLAAADLKSLEAECRETKTTWEKEKLTAEEHMNDLIGKKEHLSTAMKQQQQSYDHFQQVSRDDIRSRKRYMDNLGQRVRDAENELMQTKEGLKYIY